MIKNGYSENIIVKYSETDQNLAMKPYALLNFLQDIASKNAEDKGFGYTYVHSKNYAWFLIKYHMEFIEYPFDVQELKLTTEPRGYNKLFAFRDFELHKGEKLLARIASMWSVVDVEKRAMIPVGKALEDNPYMLLLEKREDDLTFPKLSPMENLTLQREFEVRYNDIDVNGHANNGNYIVWAFEPLNFEFKNSHKIKTLDLVYKKEARYGEKITAKAEICDNITLHKLINQSGEDLCLIECKWENI